MNITVKILNRVFRIGVESPEHEKEIRDAADLINEKYTQYLKYYPGKGTDEILSIIALNSFIDTARTRKALESTKAEEKDLHTTLKSYLDNIDKI